MRHPQSFLTPNLPFLGRSLAGDCPQQSRLPGSVSTNKTDPLTGLDLEINMSEQWQIAIGQ
jgi:hypothetical protein